MDGFSSRPPNLTASGDIFEKNKYAHAYKGYMLFVATFGHLWIFLNAAKILSSNSSEGFSTSSLMIYMTVSSSYLVYGFLRNDPILVLSSCISLVANIFLLACMFIVDNTGGPTSASIEPPSKEARTKNDNRSLFA